MKLVKAKGSFKAAGIIGMKLIKAELDKAIVIYDMGVIHTEAGEDLPLFI